MTAGTQTDSDFAFAGLATPDAEATEAIKALAGGPDPLGALAGLLGTWKGHGFNAIWRPHHPASEQDRFLELNKTDNAGVHADQRADPQPRAGDGGHRHVRPDLHAADRRREHRRGAPHRLGHLGHGAPYDRSQRTGVGGPHGVDPARHGHPGPGVAEVHPGGPQPIPNNNILPSSSAARRPRTATSTPWPRRSPS